jgi:hypothetical protein
MATGFNVISITVRRKQGQQLQLRKSLRAGANEVVNVEFTRVSCAEYRDRSA